MENFRDQIPESHPLTRTYRQTDYRRAQEDIDEIFTFENDPLDRDDIRVTPGSIGAATVEPDGFLDDEEFESFTEQAKESDALGWNPADQSNYVNESELSTPAPVNVHGNRSERAVQEDIQKKARVTTDPVKYANNPDHYDYPFVDTPAGFRDEFENESFAEMDQRAGEDNIFTW